MKSKDAMKPDIIELDKSDKKNILTKKCYLKTIYVDFHISSVNTKETKNEELLTLSGVKIHIG